MSQNRAAALKRWAGHKPKYLDVRYSQMTAEQRREYSRLSSRAFRAKSRAPVLYVKGCFRLHSGAPADMYWQVTRRQENVWFIRRRCRNCAIARSRISRARKVQLQNIRRNWPLSYAYANVFRLNWPAPEGV